MKLTKTSIEKMEYQGDGKSRDIRWDDQVPGFGVRLYPSDKRSFVVSYRFNGRKRLMVLGSVDVISLDQARKKARKVLVEVTDKVDPLEQKQREAKAGTVKALCNEYLERHAKLKKKSWKKDQSRIDRHILPAWGSLKAVDVKRPDVAALHSKIGKSAPYEANRTLALVSRIFGLARRWGYVPEGHVNPGQDIDKFGEQSRDRWVTPQELPKLVEAIDAEDNEYIRAAFWLYLLTGARKTELLNAKWDDIDWNRKELRLADTKSGRVHYLPLTSAAVTLLEALPRLSGNPYVLPGHRGGRPLVNIDKAWRRIREAAGVSDVRIHDLRRTVGSWLAQSGNSLHLIGKVLNHSNTTTTQVYARFGQDSVRTAMEQHAEKIVNVAKGETADVSPIKRRRKA